MLYRWLDALGPELEDPTLETQLRLRLTIAGSLLAGFGFGVFAGRQLMGGIAALGWIDLAASVLCFANLAALRWHRRLDVAVHLLIGCVFVALAGLTIASGGVGLPAPFILCVVPLAVTSMTGSRRAGVLWAILSVALLGFVGWLHVAGYPFPASIRDVNAQAALMLGTAGLAVLLTTLFAFSGAWLQRTAMDELAQANRDLEVAKDAARAASRAKTQFLANMSHEIRTPMNGILGSLQLLETSAGLTREGRELTGTASSSAHALLTLLDDIIDLAKVESGKMSFERVPFDVASVVCEVTRLFEVGARSKGLAVVCACPCSGPRWVEGDPVRVRQILSNLIGNAVKFTHAGEVRVTLDVLEGDVEQLRLRVEDTGIGIALDKQAQIFDAFEQADASTTRTYGGTGLGLAVSKRLARGMGGTIELTSAPGEGARFDVLLPLVRAAAPAPPAPARPTPPPSACGVVLLVEDNRVNQLVARRMLERLGYQVDTCGDGFEALQAAQARAYDAILMDCHMPGLDGYAATAALREAAVRTPIIALTASAMPAERERCLEVGMDDFLAKPIEQEALDAALRRWARAAAVA